MVILAYTRSMSGNGDKGKYADGMDVRVRKEEESKANSQVSGYLLKNTGE